MKNEELLEKLLNILEINDIEAMKAAILELINKLNGSGVSALGRNTGELVYVQEENDEKIVIQLNLYNPMGWKFIDLVMQSERARVLKKIYENRVALLKKHFKVSFSVDAKGFIFNKTENQDWKEKLESYIKADKEFCNRIDIEKELKNSGWDSGKGRGGFGR